MSVRWLRKSMVMLLVATSLLGMMVPSVGAQAGNYTIYLQPLDANSGAPIYDACFVLVNASNAGCDENGDGLIRFAEIDPGTYTVRQTEAANGYQWMGDTTISVGQGDDGRAYPIYLTAQSGGGVVDVAIVPTDSQTGAVVPGGCFVIGKVSNEGCDENMDGQITFKGIPVGTYSVTETRAPSGYDIQAPQTITFNQSGQYSFFIGSAGGDGLVHVSLVTRDPHDGELVTGTCYIIVNASIEGCDENGDGQVDFADVTPGTYTVRQTKTPAGYPAVGDFPIRITDDPNQAFPVKQAARQNDANHRNVSIVLVDRASDTRVTGPDACVQIVGASEIGCDDNSDGQIDFLDIPVGTQTVRFVKLPRGWGVENDTYTITVDATPYPNVTVYMGPFRV